MTGIGFHEAMVRFGKATHDLTEVFNKFRAAWDESCRKEMLARKLAREEATRKKVAYNMLPYEEKLRLARIADDRVRARRECQEERKLAARAAYSQALHDRWMAMTPAEQEEYLKRK